MLGIACIRAVREGLEHATYGVAAQLAALAVDADDTRPDPLERIIDPTADDAAVSQRDIPDWPFAVVTCEEPVVTTRTGVRGPAMEVEHLKVSVSVCLAKSAANSARAWRDTDYYLRAMVHALNATLFGNSGVAVAARRRGPITIVRCHSMTWALGSIDLPGATLTGELALDLHVRDDATGVVPSA